MKRKCCAALTVSALALVTALSCGLPSAHAKVIIVDESAANDSKQFAVKAGSTVTGVLETLSYLPDV